jgi:hypothetical protein
MSNNNNNSNNRADFCGRHQMRFVLRTLDDVLDYLWEDERADFEVNDCPRGHLFQSLEFLRLWSMRARSRIRCTATTVDFPGCGRRRCVGREASGPRHPESRPLFRTLVRPGEWVRQFPDVARYLVRGEHPRTVLVLGWDPPLATYFAQAWLVPSSAEEYEDGKLMLWVGTDWAEVPDVVRLVASVEKFVAVPADLCRELEAGPRMRPPRLW